MNRDWMYGINRRSSLFEDGLSRFIEKAIEHANSDGITVCPCSRCLNRKSNTIENIRLHLFCYGFKTGYTKWIHHGEDIVSSDDEGDTSDPEDEHDEMRDIFEDVEQGRTYFNIGNEMIDDLENDSMLENVQHKGDSFLEELESELYIGCKRYSALNFIVKIMNIKVLNNMSDKAFTMLLELFRDVLPEGNRCPPSYYKTKKLLRAVGLGYVNIDVCKHDCCIFYKELADADKCPVCHHKRWKKGIVPYKRMRYFPVGDRLKRFYSCRHTSSEMRWHKDKRFVEEGVLRHPADGLAWKHFDNTYPEFASDARNLRLAIASDGFNPFGNMSTNYSVWPVILIPYNLPPWRYLKQSYFIMSLMIPGPKAPGKDYDVFLKPLIDDLKLLWSDGVEAYDFHSKQRFTLRAAVLWTISDFPAYAYLSGWSTKGYKACPVCMDETPSCKVRGKQAFIGARKFLCSTHRWRKDKGFNGENENGITPRRLDGEEIRAIVDQLEVSRPGKASKIKSGTRKNDGSQSNWSKRSIFWDLPYWSSLLIRHILDVMHIEKNVCENVIGTILDIEGKSKDTIKARLDLEDMGIRKELWLQKASGGNLKKPHASYVLSKKQRDEFFKFIESVKLPDGYGSNISRIVTNEGKLVGMKTHDHHILLQKLLPTAIRPFFNDTIRATLVELSQFFEQICAKTLHMAKLDEMQREIVCTLCKMEKIFPPAFFTIMIHLCLHLPEEAMLAGPVSSRWMYCVERCLGSFKNFVRNKAKAEGSIAEAYVANDALTFCGLYLKDTETSHSRRERNANIQPDIEQHIMAFGQRLRCLGSSELTELETFYDKAHWFILNNHQSELQQYFDEHARTLGVMDEIDLARIQEEQFPGWFKTKMESFSFNENVKMKDLYALSQGPNKRCRKWSSCIVNGVRFHTLPKDNSLRTQNSGITVTSSHDGEEVQFYGVVDEILELSYLFGRKVVLFRCQWYNTSKRQKRIQSYYHLTSINTSSLWYKEDPFVLPAHVQQVFYLHDKKNGGMWRTVQKVNYRNIYEIPEQAEDVDELIDDVDQIHEGTFRAMEVDIDTRSLVRYDVAATIVENDEDDEDSNDIEELEQDDVVLEQDDELELSEEDFEESEEDPTS